MGTTTMKIDPESVNNVFRDCLYMDDEVSGDEIPDSAVLVRGILNNFAFHPGRLESHRSEVRNWLAALPHQFRHNEGGGWSFLNACDDEDGNQWTGLHLRIDQLFCLGMGLGLVKLCMPREMWNLLPGGMPYYTVEIA